MKSIKSSGLFVFGLLMLTSCFVKDEVVPKNKSSIIPFSFLGRDVEVQDNIYTSSRKVTFYVWDSGTIDGDIISLYVNGEEVMDTYELDGPSFKASVTVDLKYSGYNYVLLYAHNEGSLSPNTAALSIDDGSGEQGLILSADLYTNGAANIIVEK